MYVHHRNRLDVKNGPRNRGSFVRTQTIQNYTRKGNVNTVSSRTQLEHPRTLNCGYNAGCGKLKAQKSCSCGKPHVCK